MPNKNKPPQEATQPKAPVTNEAPDPDLVFNAMTMRSDLLQNLFDPRRDIDDECGYPKNINETQYRLMYDREMGSRVVAIYPEETWKIMPRIFEDPAAEQMTPFEESLDEFEDEYHLLHYMQRADELSGIGHYGIILWGLDDGQTLEKPVDGFEGWKEATGKPRTTAPSKHQVLYIRVLDASLVQIGTYVRDVTNPRYGQPEFYNITLADPTNLESDNPASPPDYTQHKVHWSRITHIADNRKTSEVLGTPRMQPVWNRLYDLRKVLGGSGEMFWRGGFPGVSLETQPGLENAELDEEKTQRMMFNYMNGLQRYLALTGMSAKSLGPQIANPTASFETHIKSMCIILGVPYRVFMGIEEGVVSGDQATKAWDSRLKNRQNRYVTPMIIDPVLQRLVDYGAIAPTKEPKGWTVEWPDLTVPSDMDKAEVAVKKTDALAKYVAGGVDTVISPIEFLTKILSFEKEVAEAIIDAAVEHIGSIADEDEHTPGHGPTPPELMDEQGQIKAEEEDEDEE